MMMAKLTAQEKLNNLIASATDFFSQGIVMRVILSPGRVQVFSISGKLLFDVRNDGTVGGVVVGRKAQVGTEVTEPLQAELRRLAEKYHKEIINIDKE